MKYSALFSIIFISLSVSGMDRKKKDLLAISTSTASRDRSPRAYEIGSARRFAETAELKKEMENESCCVLLSRILYNAPAALVCFPIVWAHEAFIEKKIKSE